MYQKQNEPLSPQKQASKQGKPSKLPPPTPTHLNRLKTDKNNHVLAKSLFKMQELKGGMRLSTAQNPPAAVQLPKPTLGGKMHHKRSAQTNSTAMRHLLELFSKNNGQTIQNASHHKKEGTFLASQSAALATMAALTDCTMNKKSSGRRRKNTAGYALHHKKGSSSATGGVASSALILAVPGGENITGRRPAESSLGLGKKYPMLAVSTLGSNTGGTFFLPSKVQGYKQRYPKHDESNLAAGVRKKKDKKPRLGHFSKQVLRQLVGGPIQNDEVLDQSQLTERKKAAPAKRRFSVSKSLTVEQRSLTETSSPRSDDYAGFSSCPSADDQENSINRLRSENVETTLARKPPAMTSVQSNRVVMVQKRESVSMSEARGETRPVKKCGSLTNNDLLDFALRQQRLRRPMRDGVHTSTEKQVPPTPLDLIAGDGNVKSPVDHSDSNSDETVQLGLFGAQSHYRATNRDSSPEFQPLEDKPDQAVTINASPIKARERHPNMEEEPQRLQKWLGESGAVSCSDGSSSAAAVISKSAGYSVFSDTGEQKSERGVGETKTPSRAAGDRGKHLPRTPLLLPEGAGRRRKRTSEATEKIGIPPVGSSKVTEIKHSRQQAKDDFSCCSKVKSESSAGQLVTSVAFEELESTTGRNNNKKKQKTTQKTTSGRKHQQQRRESTKQQAQQQQSLTQASQSKRPIKVTAKHRKKRDNRDSVAMSGGGRGEAPSRAQKRGQEEGSQTPIKSFRLSSQSACFDGFTRSHRSAKYELA